MAPSLERRYLQTYRSIFTNSILDGNRPPNCPPCPEPDCFNCQLPANECYQFGECNQYDGLCSCPTGFVAQTVSRLSVDRQLTVPSDSPRASLGTTNRADAQMDGMASTATSARLTLLAPTFSLAASDSARTVHATMEAQLSSKASKSAMSPTRRSSTCFLVAHPKSLSAATRAMRPATFSFGLGNASLSTAGLRTATNRSRLVNRRTELRRSARRFRASVSQIACCAESLAVSTFQSS